ncbi:DUF664 domain-containing protein [Mycobacterium aquaticum]|nr:DUF664 domain-containing protein [Mycobacterium aquaticum]
MHEHLRTTRHHVLGTVTGLDDQALRQPVLPTGWTCLSMLSHLTHDVENFWFRAVVAAEPRTVAHYERQPLAGWHVGTDADALAVIDGYRRACDAADAVIEVTSPTTSPRWWPAEQFGDWRLPDFRAVMLHVIIETATHAGHLDAARELLDGGTWLILE